MNKLKKILVCGAGGFIGSHLVKALKEIPNTWVYGIDLKHPEFSKSEAHVMSIGDLRDMRVCEKLFSHNKFDEVYQLAADMGGAGYINTGDHDADVMSNSALININVVKMCHKYKVKKILFTSTACVYPEENQLDPNHPICIEDCVYPANPDTEYGWEKLFSERVYQAYHKNYGMDIRIIRLHNVFGPEGTWEGGKEKAPAAICRKVINARKYVEVWGEGDQTRSFMYIDECVTGLLKIMESNITDPINLGSDRLISMNDFTQMVIDLSEKNLTIKNVKGPEGVKGRKSDNTMILERLGWAPSNDLEHGVAITYEWIKEQVKSKKSK